MKHLLLLTAFFLSLSGTAQTDTTLVIGNPDTAIVTNESPKAKKPYFRNVVKMNLASLYANNYNFSYERLITRKTSVIASFRTMPQTNLSTLKLVDQLVRITKEDAIQEDLSMITGANKTFTAEIRFYGGRKPGAKGFYLGLYGRTAGFDLTYNYDYSVNGKDYNIPLQMEARGLGGGFVTGWQFAIARRVMFDIYLLGAHYGKMTGDFNGAANLSDLTPDEQQDLQQDLDDLFYIKGKQYMQTTVSNNGVTGKISGPFAGLRGLGFSVGVAF